MADPLVTVFMPCFRQPDYIREALRSALAQTYSPLEIIVIDNCSPDETPAIAAAEAKAYSGPHQVSVLRNRANLGIESLNVLARQARGEFIVECHSDDISRPERVAVLVEAWRRTGASLITSNCHVTDAQGNAQGVLFGDKDIAPLTAEDIADNGWRRTMLGATFGYSKAMLTEFEPFDRRRTVMAHDWVMPFRAAIANGVHIEPRPLLSFRLHDESQTKLLVMDGQKSPVLVERIGYHHTMNILWMQTTLDAAPSRYLSDERRADLRRRLEARLQQSARLWVAARNALLLEGRVLAWTESQARPRDEPADAAAAPTGQRVEPSAGEDRWAALLGR